MSVCARWTGVETKAFRSALRLVREEFAEYVGVSVDAVKKWERLRADIALSPAYATRMDEKLGAVEPAVAERFWAILGTPTALDRLPPAELGEKLGARDDDECIIVSARALTGEPVLVTVPRRTFAIGIGAGAIGAATAGIANTSAGNSFAAMFADASINHVRRRTNVPRARPGARR
ncbi:helix-turn-helix domain-containing protein [Nocardia sp. NPDC059764]|uniref:helix-turn-helix domain-containing protein n=1 Tax=Nocardia sp. NPDC059764 TaxID=3346939 RepID=UPI0036654B91